VGSSAGCICTPLGFVSCGGFGGADGVLTMPVEYVEAVKNHVGGSWAGGEPATLVKGKARALGRGVGVAVAPGCSSSQYEYGTLRSTRTASQLYSCMTFGALDRSTRIAVADGGSCNVGGWGNGSSCSSAMMSFVLWG
jgi:hypothetical protein